MFSDRPGRLIALIALLSACAAPVAGAATLPNIVLIVIDDLGWADLGCYGADLHETPHIDRFADSGVRFTDAYAAAPICSPTRASIMSGKFPARLHMTIWREQAVSGPQRRGPLVTAESEANLPHAEITMAEALREQGYLTAHIGKWHLGDAEHYPETHGFDVNIGASLWGAPSTFFFPYRGAFGRSGEYRYVPGLDWGQEGEYLTDRLTDEAIHVIERAGDRPFFLNLWYHSVHTPIEAPAEDVARFQQKLQPGMHHQNPTYAAMAYRMDQNVGRVLKVLRERGLEDNTAVLLVSDNGGYINPYEGLPVTSNAPLRSGKGSLYEGGIRVPLIVRVPGVSAAGGVCKTPVYTADLYPTCLAIAGAKGNEAHDGVDLRRLLERPGDTLDREALYFHYPHFYATTTPVGAVRAGNWKLLHYYDDGHDELYNLADDLGESRDLVSTETERAKTLRRYLDGWLNAVDARLPTLD